jgi:hypothetical protein
MSDTTPVLRARTTTAPATITETHSVDMAKATAIAKAGELVPKAYRANPGAVLLALGWADQHGLDPWTAMESMTFIQGKRTISAEMQAALADRAGFRVTPTDVSDTAATVAVVDKRTGETIGQATFTIDDAKAMGLTGKDNWRKMPRQMLVARARTMAIRWFCPGVLVGLHDADEITDPVHTVTATIDTADSGAAPSGEESPNPQVGRQPEGSSSDDVEDAEIVEETGETISPATRGNVRAAIDIAKAAGRWPHPLADQFTDAGLPIVANRMTETQGLLALDLLANDTTDGNGER